MRAATDSGPATHNPRRVESRVRYNRLFEFKPRECGGFLAQSPSGPASGGLYTRLLADDITPIAGYAGQKINKVKFTVGNSGTTNVVAQLNVRLYASDCASGEPGTLMTAFSGSPFLWPAGLVHIVTFDTSSASISLPANTFWAGVTFSDGGGGATQAQLNGMGQDVITPPTIGTSDDVIFLTDNPGSFNASNPLGTLGDFGGNPAANLGWEFVVVPEPSSFIIFCLGLIFIWLMRNGRHRPFLELRDI